MDFEVVKKNEHQKCAIEFGKQLRALFYLIDPKLAPTNHGSYGSAPRPVLDRKHQLQHEMEQSPDVWFRYSIFDLWTASLTSLADFLHVDKANILIGENATENINSVLKSIQLDPNTDAILTTSLNYQSILFSIDYTSRYRFSETRPVYIHQIEMKLPIRDGKQIVDYFDQACSYIVEKKKLRLRLAVVDHISSATAILYPVSEINKTIRKWSPKCTILIDGAHAIGQIKLDFKEIDCDFYVSNLHKWLFAPRSCSFIYTPDPKNFTDHHFQPCYISWGYYDPSTNFCQRATTDKTSWFVVPECVRFSEEYLGGYENISGYSSRLANDALVMLERAWNTRRLDIGADIEAPYMKVVKLPPLKDYVIGPEPASVVCSKLIRRLIQDFNVVGCAVEIESQLYVRISAFVYNSIDDYERLRDAILSLAVV